MFSFETFITRTSIFISLLVFVTLDNEITAEKVFAVTAIYNVIRPVITMIFSISISSIAEVNVSVKRIQKFLSYAELTPQHQKEIFANGKIKLNGSISNGSLKTLSKDPCIKLDKIRAKWMGEAKEDTLKDINISINGDKLVAVIGPVGSGKSSIFNVILKEFPISSGNLDVEGRISFSSQEPWLFSGSVRQNILFGDEYDESRYKDVIKVCALESDLAILPYGDRTMVGERGKALSGGQKARVNLARCIYKEADVYLLDDPLSAVDAKVGKQLYEDCIEKYLRGKIRILITHQLQYLKNADNIIILKDGAVEKQGTFAELQKSGLDFAKLLEEFNSAEEDDNEKKLKLRQMSETIEEEDAGDGPENDKEAMESGHVKFKVYASYFKAGGNYWTIALLTLCFILCQLAGNGADYFVTYWVNLEQDMMVNNSTSSSTRQPIIYTYAGIILVLILFAVIHCIYYFIFLMKASIRLHDYTFTKVSQAVMRFFNTNSSGRILNRFSKDLGIVDEYIPLILFDVIEVRDIINDP